MESNGIYPPFSNFILTPVVKPQQGQGIAVTSLTGVSNNTLRTIKELFIRHIDKPLLQNYTLLLTDKIKNGGRNSV